MNQAGDRTVTNDIIPGGLQRLRDELRFLLSGKLHLSEEAWHAT